MHRFAALDTKFLLALAGGEPDAEATLDYLHKTGFFPVITPCVMEQLGELTTCDDEMTRTAAAFVAKWYVTWGVLPVENQLTQTGTSQVHADRLLEQGLIPGASTLEAEMLVEASCHNCELLITFNQPLLDAPPAPLNLALLENDLNKVTVTIASPSIIAERLRMLPSNVKATVGEEAAAPSI